MEREHLIDRAKHVASVKDLIGRLGLEYVLDIVAEACSHLADNEFEKDENSVIAMTWDNCTTQILRAQYAVSRYTHIEHSIGWPK